MTAEGNVGAVPERVGLERRGHILVITMERTAKKNAIDAQMTAALDEAFNHLDDDPELWCGVLTGGPGIFSAGTDLALGSGEPTARGGQYGLISRRRRTPLIAAVEGAALGGGFELVLACDLVIAARSSRFGLPEVSRGVVPTCGGLFRGPRSLPLTVAKQLVLTGRPLTAARGFELGLVNDLAVAGGALEVAVEMAEQICENSPSAVAASLTAMGSIFDESDEFGQHQTEVALAEVTQTEDFHEGITAFLEKRPPQWTNR